MFAGIEPDKLLAMSEQELRWFDNVKKAFHESDLAYTDGRAQDRCLPELCSAVDTAKLLRRSLRGDDTSPRENKKRFVEFLNLELPSPESGGFQVSLTDARSGRPETYSFAELVYDIRCMIHENENLNAAEAPNYHILLDWSSRDPACFGSVANGRLTCNAHLVWQRLRQILAKFITGIDGMVAYARMIASGHRESFSITISPPLGSVRPRRGDRR
ncbi:MAG: hypothetical protein K2X82_20795 [Gemmataceae bacterium]|nr:hypothetical protein [Gemmataceae bacterium]